MYEELTSAARKWAVDFYLGVEHEKLLYDMCDALEALESRISTVTTERDGYKGTIDSMGQINNAMAKRLSEVTAERDAALLDLRGVCRACSHYTSYHNSGPCATCSHETARHIFTGITDKWEWRGPQKEAGRR